MSKRQIENSTLFFAVLDLATYANGWIQDQQFAGMFGVRAWLLDAMTATVRAIGGHDLPIHMGRLRAALDQCEAAFKGMRREHPQFVEELLLRMAKVRSLDLGAPPHSSSRRPSKPRTLN